MKRIPLFSKMFLGAAIVALSFGVQSCKNEPKHEDPKEVAEDENEAKFDDVEKDADYLVTAAEVDMKEIELGKLAQLKSTNADVKALGKMMEEAHTKSLTELNVVASAKNITLPASLTEKGQDAYGDLNDKTGHDFDKAYTDKMVEGHEKMIDKMVEASEKAKEADVRMWAANLIPTLRAHLEHAKATKEKVDAIK